MKKFLILLAFLLPSSALAQPAPSAPGPMYGPNWPQGYVPTPYQWQVMWTNKLGYFPGGLPFAYGGCAATSAGQCLVNLGAAPAFTAKAANTVFSGPATGADALPTFRALVTADLPASITGAGPIGTGALIPVITYNSKGQLTAVTTTTNTPAVSAITGAGTGILAALAINVGTAGSPVVNGGALGTPSSGVATNFAGTAASLTAGSANNVAGATPQLSNAAFVTCGSLTTVANVITCGAASGGGNALFGTATGNVANHVVTMSNTTVGVQDSGILISALAPLASPTFTGTQTLTTALATTWNGNTITPGSGTLTLGAGKTATVSNTLNFTGTDGSSVNVGAGGTILYAPVALASLATQATNTVLGNATSGSAAPTALAIGSCSTSASALIWTTNTGFSCNTAIAVPLSGITGLGTGVATWLGTPSFTNLSSAVTGQTIAALGLNQNFTASQRGSNASITISTSTFTPNFDTAQNYSATLVHASCPCTIANPSTTPVANQSGTFQVIQSSTGSDTIGTWGSQYKFAGGVKPTLSTAANAVDTFSYFVVDSTHIQVGTFGLAFQ